MKIGKIILKGFKQFENFCLDLVTPETDQPPDKVCLIGPNGTGKSTLLQLIIRLLNKLDDSAIAIDPNELENEPFFGVKFYAPSGIFFACYSFYIGQNRFRGKTVYYKADVETSEEWHRFVTDPTQQTVPPNFCEQYRILSPPIQPLASNRDIVIHAPADQSLLLPPGGLPTTTLNEALNLFKEFPVFHSVSMPNADDFWKVLIYLIKKRESDYQQYLKNPENKKKTVEEVETEFGKNHPEILPEIDHLWNRILAKAGLEFDTEGARIPVQLNENLQAYVKVKSSGLSLPYNSLSSGIRNYIFKLGHIRALYFQRKIERGFLLVDEPENSLYPDLLYDLIDEYLSITENTQLFVATHSPIIAAQFEPYERIHLDFDERGFVTATHGVTPIGDDPNDLLIKDFHVRSIYGKQGLQKWERFLELQRLISKTSDVTRKQQLIDEYLAIGNAYNFDPSR
jgi:ABC-type polar amino acid transport system ATPase subunit